MVSTSDKASANQRLIKMHGKSFTYKAVNLFARERFIYFMSDVPHLVKTVRNNLESSGSAPHHTRHLWVSYNIGSMHGPFFKTHLVDFRRKM